MPRLDNYSAMQMEMHAVSEKISKYTDTLSPESTKTLVAFATLSSAIMGMRGIGIPIKMAIGMAIKLIGSAYGAEQVVVGTKIVDAPPKGPETVH